MPASFPVFIGAVIVENHILPSACIYVVIENLTNYGIGEGLDSFISGCKVVHGVAPSDDALNSTSLPAPCLIRYDKNRTVTSLPSLVTESSLGGPTAHDLPFMLP